MSSGQSIKSTLSENIDFPLDQTKIGIVTAEWNDDITFAMRDACISELAKFGVAKENIIAIEVPGAFELPAGAKFLLNQHSLHAVICIGCVIKGETKHDEYISNAVASGIMSLGLHANKPVIFGVLTPNDHQQAIDRAGGKYGNKGIEAAHTAIKMIQLQANIKEQVNKKIGF
jgi:6,7-dimethyl-8-ribityllumazine synthase